jgi:hypothetical protein
MTRTDRLSASQDQLLTSIQQLQTAQRENMNEYGSAQTDNERSRIMAKMKQNEALRANLLASAGTVNLVQTQEVVTRKTTEQNIAELVEFAQDQLKTQLEQLEALQESHDGKKRMIEINTYYGKRFMAQAGVMKIFIYMCIPVLILAILANAGLFPSYIAGFMIVAIVIVGVVYIYAAVHDINRRDNRNFDEYTWEFDPSRVGTIVNPNYGTTGSGTNGDMVGVGCFNGKCCGKSTKWDEGTRTCVQNAQGDGSSSVKGTSSLKSTPASFMGDLKS